MVMKRKTPSEKFADEIHVLYREIGKAADKFQFQRALSILEKMERELKSVLTCGNQDGWEDMDVPARVRWFAPLSDLSDAGRMELVALAQELRCNCIPQKCRCRPLLESVVETSGHCEICDAALLRGETANWLAPKACSLCQTCSAILYESLYPERAASDKLDKVLYNIYQFSLWTRYAEGLELVQEARGWLLQSEGLPHATQIEAQP